jgi:hypothetical protein
MLEMRVEAAVNINGEAGSSAMTSAAKSNVFLSYSSRDNHTPNARVKGWVQYFYEYLESMLIEKGYPGLPVWRDWDNLRGNDDLREKLRQALHEAELMVAVLSYNYFDQSAWCETELREFFRKCGGGADRARHLFRVFPDKLGEDRWPQDLGRFDASRGYWFFTEEANNRIERYYTAGRCDYRQKYRKRMVELVKDIAKMLGPPPRPSARPLVTLELDLRSGPPGLFLTASDAETEEYALRLREELERRGIAVSHLLSDDFRDRDQLQNLLSQRLSGCRLSIHMIGLDPGPPVGEMSLSRFVLHCVKDAATSARRVIWIPRTVWSKLEQQGAAASGGRTAKPADDEHCFDSAHADFLRELDKGDHLDPSDEFIRGEFETLRELVKETLEADGGRR